jgi:hypothetical protein
MEKQTKQTLIYGTGIVIGVGVLVYFIHRSNSGESSLAGSGSPAVDSFQVPALVGGNDGSQTLEQQIADILSPPSSGGSATGGEPAPTSQPTSDPVVYVAPTSAPAPTAPSSPSSTGGSSLNTTSTSSPTYTSPVNTGGWSRITALQDLPA